MDGVWTVTIPLTSDYYEYKFTVNGWAADENLAGIGGCVTENFGFTNRVLQVFSNQSEPVVCWNSCSNCEGGGDIAGCTDPNAVNYAAIATVDDGSCQYNVTFQVDMSTTALNGGDIVYVNGGFNGWCGACNPMSDDDMDGVWTVTLPLPGGEHEYKFTINGWDMQEELTIGDVCDWNPNDTFANRGFNLTGDLVLDVVCYNSCYSCDVSTGCTDEAAQNYDADADVDVEDSILGVVWPTRDNNYSFTFAFYLPSESQGIHAMHVCGFLFANECLNEKPFPGKPFGRCGESDADNASETGYFCDFIQLYEKTEPNAGIFASGTESLERLGAHVESFGEDALTSIELHVDLVALGDYSAAPPPGDVMNERRPGPALKVMCIPA